MFCMNMVHFHVLSVGAVLEFTQSRTRSALSGCLRSAEVSRADLLQTQTMFAQGFLDKCSIDGRTVTKVKVDGPMLDVEASYGYLGYMFPLQFRVVIIFKVTNQ